MTHTAGPWTVHTADWGAGGNARYTLSGIKEISKADARLIAAAPDLLEALQAMASSFHDVEHMGPGGHKAIAARKARAAIAKATGASS
jgi:hypothetical protein